MSWFLDPNLLLQLSLEKTCLLKSLSRCNSQNRTQHSAPKTGGQGRVASFPLDVTLAFFGNCVTLLIHPVNTANISQHLVNANNYHGYGASQITKSFQKCGLIYSSQQSQEVNKDEETKVFPRTYAEASSPKPMSPNPCSSKHTHIVFSLESLLRPRKSPWLHMLVAIQTLFFF